jgi:hypothetical protein
MGSRFFLSYAGSAPSSATLDSLASSIASAWGTHLQPSTQSTISLTEIDILDIATDSGASGSWTGDLAGGGTAESLPVQCAVNIEFDIARRYRGGKPRMFHPPPDADALENMATWNSSFVTSMNTNFSAFMSEIEALTPGSLTALTHVNLSYYQSFQNVTNSSGRTRAAPKYRTTALVDTITGYATKTVIGSQRRRRTSTTP